MDNINKNCKILLIEENEIWQSGVYNLLLTKNIKLTDIADNTHTAIDKIKVLNPDLVISDMSSERVNGFKIVDEIKKMNSSSKTIFFCSQICSQKIDEALKLGVEGLCYRTNNLSKLERAISTTLNGDIYIDGQMSAALKTTKETDIANSINRKIQEENFELNNVLASNEEIKAREKLKKFELTELQIKVFMLLCENKTNEEIAARLHFSVNNIKYHVRQLKNKLNLQSRLELVVAGWKMGLLTNSVEDLREFDR